MLDFVTIIFKDIIEINLLKLQAFTFTLVDVNIINKIYVVFNDSFEKFNEFKDLFYNTIINCYPDYLRDKVILLSIEDMSINTKFKATSWFTQQIIKIEISKHVEMDYYVVLDGKNHFKEFTNLDFFFNNGKPKLNFNSNGDKMLEFYYNCLNYFKVECPNRNEKNERLKIQTTTPFIFIRQICLDLIAYVEFKENTCFFDFINSKKTYTEFFLYYAFIIYLNKEQLYFYHHNQSVVTIGAIDPKIHVYNSWINKINELKNNKINFISLHRKCFKFLDDEYKSNLLEYYNLHYKSKNITEIMDKLLQSN